MTSNQRYTIISLIVLALCFMPGVFEMLINFILVGAIPGTQYSLPFWLMLVITLGMIPVVFALSRTIKRAVATFAQAALKSQRSVKRRLPIRRFSDL